MAAALVGAPSKAILSGWRTILTATHRLLWIWASAATRSVAHSAAPQLGRHSEAHIFANQIEIAMIRKSQAGQPLAHLLDQNFRRRSAGGEPERCLTPSSEASSISLASSIKRAATPARLATSTRRLEFELFAEPTTKINSTSRRQRFDGFLAILRCIADVVGRRSFNCPENAGAGARQFPAYRRAKEWFA